MFEFLFHKKAEGPHYQHQAKRSDWERMLDELFVDVVFAWHNGVAILSNTAKTDGDDSEGSLYSGLTYRIKDRLAPALKEAVRQCRREHFEQIFTHAQNHPPHEADCYLIKNLGLPNNSLVFPILGAEGRRALLVFGGEYIKHELSKRLEKVNQLLEHPRPGKLPPASPSQAPAKIPAPIALARVPKTSPEVIKARFNYLEDLTHPTPAQIHEMEYLDSYLKDLFKRALK